MTYYKMKFFAATVTLLFVLLGKDIAIVQAQGFTAQEILNLSAEIWDADDNAFVGDELSYNITGDTLFTHVDQNKLNTPAYALFIKLLNNYDPAIGDEEPSLTPEEEAETSAFLDHVVSSECMKIVEAALIDANIIGIGQMKNVLYSLWFTFYSRSKNGPVDSSGFEHVFVGEYKRNKVIGFHNWVQAYSEEKNGNMEYLGYNAIGDPDLLDLEIKWFGKRKSRNSMFMGYSPNFDMALYTLCIVARPDADCFTNLNNNFVTIKTFTVTHVSSRRVATAFPEV